MNKKLDTAYKTIGELTKDLGLIDKNTGKLQTHTLRYWETQFKEIRPAVRAGNRRYYSNKNIKIIKQIFFLLKKKGLTISGAKKVLNNSKIDCLDQNIDLGVYKSDLMNKNTIKNKLKNISKIISELKNLK